MSDPIKNVTRRTVLKQSGVLGVGVVGATRVTSAASGEVVASIKRDVADPIETNDIRRVQAEVKREYAQKYGGTLRLGVNPSTADGQNLVGYGLSVGEDGRARRYYGFAPAESGAETVSARHAAVDRFTQPRGPISTQGSSTDNLSEYDSKMAEAGSCDSGTLILNSSLYQKDDDASVWGMKSNLQVIPAINESECDSIVTTSTATAGHDWDYSFATDPTIADRAPTGEIDGTTTKTYEVSYSTSGITAAIGVSYSQPDLFFQSTGGSEIQDLNWDYTDSSKDTTMDTEYSTICELGEVPGFNDVVGLDSADARFGVLEEVSVNNSFVIN